MANVIVTTTIEIPDYEILQDIAKKENISMAKLIRMIVQGYLNSPNSKRVI